MLSYMWIYIVQTDQSTWSSMQAIAEEKRKAYRCVVWTSEPMSAEKLSQLETFIVPSSESAAGSDPSLKVDKLVK